MSVSVEDLKFLVLSNHHLHHLLSFKCKNSELKDFLVDDAYRNQLDHISVTRLVFYKGRLIGYFTLVTDVIRKKELIDGDGKVSKILYGDVTVYGEVTRI